MIGSSHVQAGLLCDFISLFIYFPFTFFDAGELMAADQTLTWERKGKKCRENEESRRWSLTSVNHFFLLQQCQVNPLRVTQWARVAGI